MDNSQNNNNNNDHDDKLKQTNSINRKRSYDDVQKIDNNGLLLHDTKRQKMSNLNNLNNDKEKITAEDMEFLFKMKAQNHNNSSSLHINNDKKYFNNRHINVTTDINHESHFKPPSIASTNNSIGIDVLSTTATIKTNPDPSTISDDNIYIKDKNKEKASDVYYKQIVHRPSRVGDTFQASILPKCITNDQQNDNNDDKYGGNIIQINEPQNVANNIRNKRNQKRIHLNEKYDDNGSNDYKQPMLWNQLFNNNIDHDNDDDDDDDDDDGDFDGNIDEDDDDEDDEDFVPNGNQGNDIKQMDGILSRRSDWLPGDAGCPNDNNTRLQYLVKWKNIDKPVWEFADELIEYQEQIDKFEDDEMEDIIDAQKFINLNLNNNNNDTQNKIDNNVQDVVSKTAINGDK